MDNPLDKLEETFEMQLPLSQAPTFDAYLDAVLGDVHKYSEDLREMNYYVAPGGKPWMEVRDDPNFQEAVLHFFNEGGEYLQSVDGNVSKGTWRLLDGTNKMIIEQASEKGPAKSELYEKAFLNPRFFILKKHGNQHLKGRHKYFAMGFEPYVRGLTWMEYVELLYNEYRSHWGMFQWILLIALVIVIGVVVFSLM